MSNDEHLEILKRGVDTWNRWRKEHHILPDLSEANLSMADLSEANLSEANLVRADLSKANLIGANLSIAKLVEADLRNSILHDANLSTANLSGADLTGASLFWANFRGANLSGANLTGAVLGSTILVDNDLSAVEGLDSVQHSGSSSIGIDTIYRSGGNIPSSFLLSAGVPDTFLTLMHSLVAQSFDYYTCFISYSSEDREFAEKLHADLQAAGVRCWFAPVDLKIGDNWLDRIDEAIRVHDRLLLVLSKDFIVSKWIASEVVEALAKEFRERRTILFPIRLDNSIMDTKPAWMAALLATRQIGDFREWKNHDLYQRALSRLIRDLTFSVAREADEQERVK
jgi:uncharacterized protein YjbI with pentapeptide repeats